MRFAGMALILTLPWLGGMPVLGQNARATTDIAAVQEMGSVMGHVVCGDTQRPARVAQVRLVPLAPAKAAGSAVRPAGDDTLGNAINPVETAVDGSFQVPRLKPGRYIVRVDLGGYLVPLLTFTAKQLQQPDEATRQRMATDLQIVDVQAHAEAHVEVTLQRGAVVAGTVRYDDGSPAIGLAVQLIHPGADGKWEVAPAEALNFNITDGRGQFTFFGIPPDRYAVRATLALNEQTSSSMPMPTGETVEMTMVRSFFELPVYSGDVLRQRDAIGFKVEGSGDDGGHDLVIPLSKLHHVAGQVLAPDGHALNAGKVQLRYPDDGSVAVGGEIDRNTRQFRFPYVPEGTFSLVVEQARDVTTQEVPSAPGVLPRTHTEEKTVRRYGEGAQPLVIGNDVEGVLLTVPEASLGSKAAPSGAD